jgi:hypothetical protein
MCVAGVGENEPPAPLEHARMYAQRVERDRGDRHEELGRADSQQRQRRVERGGVEIGEPRVPHRHGDIELLALVMHAVDRVQHRDAMSGTVIHVVAEVGEEESEHPRDPRAFVPADERPVPVRVVVQRDQQGPDEEAEDDLAHPGRHVADGVGEPVRTQPGRGRAPKLEQHQQHVRGNAERVIRIGVEAVHGGIAPYRGSPRATSPRPGLRQG